jgi:hypothetical protein
MLSVKNNTAAQHAYFDSSSWDSTENLPSPFEERVGAKMTDKFERNT